MVVSGGHDLTIGRFSEAERPQREAKAELIASSWALLGIDAVSWGSSDWKLGDSFLFGLAEQHDLPVVAANLSCEGARPFPGHRVVEVDGARVGIVGVTDGVDGGRCVQEPALPALQRAIEEMGPVDFTIGLLPYRSADKLETIAAASLPLDLVIDPSVPRLDKSPRRLQGLPLVSAGSRTKYLGIAGLQVRSGARGVAAANAEQVLEERVSSLEARIASVRKRAEQEDDPKRQKALQDQETAYQARIRDAQTELEEVKRTAGRAHGIVLRTQALDKTIVDHAGTRALVDATLVGLDGIEAKGTPLAPGQRLVAAGSPFAGGEACVSCHRPQHLQWSTTGHARAWNSLVAEKRAMDRDCWACHVTGANAEGGPAAPAEVAGFHDVQCEACHGPSRAHIAAPEKSKSEKTPSRALCTTCHDGVRDEGRFDFRAYLAKVAH